MKVKLIDITEKPIEKIFKAYRICYSKNCYEDVAIKTEKEMINFILPLMNEQHTSPLEHVSFSFSIEGISRACLSQLTRHRTFKFNVQSQRYVDGKNFDFVIPDLSYITDATKRIVMQEHFKSLFKTTRHQYEELLRGGVKKEDARAILPQATTCNLIVTMDLHNFRNFLRQRLCSHAQTEIRELANKMVELIKPTIPFVDYKVLRCQQGLCKQCKGGNK